MRDFNTQGLANTAWVFAMVSKSGNVLLDPIFALDAMESRGADHQVMRYQMAMHGFAATGQIQAGFVLLARVEANGLLCHSDGKCYVIYHTLLEACRSVGDFKAASRVQMAVDLLSLAAHAPNAVSEQ